jgi:hypothetical protein
MTQPTYRATEQNLELPVSTTEQYVSQAREWTYRDAQLPLVLHLAWHSSFIILQQTKEETEKLAPL